MQDPDQTIPVPKGQGYNTPVQPQWPALQPPNGQPQGQFPPQANGWPPVPQSPYPQMPSQQPAPGAYNPGPGQFSGYAQSGPGQQFPQSPQTPRPPKKRGLLLAIIEVIVLLILGVGGFLAFTHNPAQKTSNQNTAAQSSSTHVATAQASASQSSTGKNASAGSSAQSSASSDNNGAQAQATAVVSTALAQAQSQGGNASSQAQALAQAGPPTEVAKSFFTAVQNQDYATAYKYTSFKSFTSESFQQASTASDQSLGKLASYTLGKTTLIPGSDTVKAQVAVTITRANVPSHPGLAMLVLENGTWKITDGTVWQ